MLNVSKTKVYWNVKPSEESGIKIVDLEDADIVIGA